MTKQNQGWKNEKYRHSIASRGIKTMMKGWEPTPSTERAAKKMFKAWGIISKKLTKKERKHLNESGITDQYLLKKQVEYMKSIDPKLRCWDCWQIARKIGMIEDSDSFHKEYPSSSNQFTKEVTSRGGKVVDGIAVFKTTPKCPHGEAHPELCAECNEWLAKQYEKGTIRERAQGKPTPGGMSYKAHKQPADFNQEQLKKGQKVEFEHTNDPIQARKIAMDHLTEFPGYYKELDKMENKLEKQKKR